VTGRRALPAQARSSIFNQQSPQKEVSMTTPTRLSVPEHETEELKPASGAPLPLRVRPIQAGHPALREVGLGGTVGSAPVATAPAAPVLPFPVRRPEPRTATPASGEAELSQPTRERATTSLDDARTREQIRDIAKLVAQGSLEVLAGTRPPQQMARWLDPHSYEKLQLRAGLIRRLQQGPANAADQGRPLRLHRNVTIRSIRTCRITTAVYECSLVVAEQQRVRAIALRIQHRRGFWRVTALEIG
jgi:hypothetical protein